MTIGKFWWLTTLFTLISIFIGVVVTFNFNWIYGIIIYFICDFVLDGLLFWYAMRNLNSDDKMTTDE